MEHVREICVVNTLFTPIKSKWQKKMKNENPTVISSTQSTYIINHT